MTPTHAATLPADRLRQVGVTVAEILCVVGTLVGIGVIGTRVAESSGMIEVGEARSSSSRSAIGMRTSPPFSTRRVTSVALWATRKPVTTRPSTVRAV